ncbi:LysR family transcriptional regulator [Trinickia dinghuensis]|uniref:LysR family transcriptional regulator n=1 Tax=Trinickia dinghuensis TaxID=2291023 RepID=A0A3D8JU18_9BURK|nr:LysR family transcriptional regulator [Trinickia dinghuensis]RDU96215.1 LysR family transcriptional regulator [Trinickia dinghuensis]
MKEISGEQYPEWDLLVSWVAVVASGSISRAASQLGISQAGLSQRVMALESTLDANLLDRTTRPARPTDAGKRLYEQATILLQSADQMVDSVRNLTRAKRNVVRLGCIDSFAAVVGPMIIKALVGTSHQVRLWSGMSSVLHGQLESRQLDLAVTNRGPAESAGIHCQLLFSEPYVVVLPASFQIDRLTTLTELSSHLQFIRYSARQIVGQEIEHCLQLHSENIERSCEFDASDPLMSLVAAGIGFALTTPLCIWQSRLYLPDLKVLPLSAFSGNGRPYAEMIRSFYMCFRENELGSLPRSLHDLIRVGYESQIAKEMAHGLGMPVDQVYLHP